MKSENVSTRVKRMQVKKLTPNDLVKITGGCRQTRDCIGPTEATCLAYIVKQPV